ncbi:MAG TPA: flagellar hook-basal body complex protein FliE [Polyangiaceae bacterium]|nr:flagellar hook-basal body complex protein FliE [Polyangiaceae bacterium]
MAIGPIEGSPISLLQAHEPFASQVAPASEPATDALSAAGDGFLGLVIKANERSQAAMSASQALAAGQSDDIHGTMIAVSEAAIETRLVVNVKDKIMDAFYEIWRMNI